LLGKKYNYVSDIWSFGLIMIELATGKYPYPVNKAMVIIDMLDITSEYPSPNLPDNGLYSEDFRDFISRCMEKDPKKRATAVELLVIS
jgi:Serine/threonine protein kinase